MIGRLAHRRAIPAVLLALAVGWSLAVANDARHVRSSPNAPEPSASSAIGCQDGTVIDFGITPDAFGDAHACFQSVASQITSQFQLTHGILFGTAAGGAPVGIVNDYVSNPSCRSSGLPQFSTNWVATFEDGTGGCVGVGSFTAEVGFVDLPDTVSLVAYDVAGQVIDTAETTVLFGHEYLTVTDPSGSNGINRVEVIAELDPGGVSVDCLAFNPPSLLEPALDIPDFSDLTDVTLNGQAETVTTQDGVVLRLNRSQGGAGGAAFLNTPMQLAAGFNTAFSFRITQPGGIVDCEGNNGADGITFTMHNDPAGPSAIGALGGAFAYEGLTNSVAVEFDTWCNGGWDPDGNHVAIDIGFVNHNLPGNGPVQTVATPLFGDGEIRYAWIDYDGTTMVLDVYVSGFPVKPGAPTLSHTIDLSVPLGGDAAFVGFTAATGGAFENHDILGWDVFLPCSRRDPCAVNGDCLTGLCGASPSDGSPQASDFSWVQPVDTLITTLLDTQLDGITFTFDIEPDAPDVGFRRDSGTPQSLQLETPAGATSNPVTITFTEPLLEFGLTVADLDFTGGAAQEFLDTFDPAPTSVTGSVTTTGVPINLVEPTVENATTTLWWQLDTPTTEVGFRYSRTTAPEAVGAAFDFFSFNRASFVCLPATCDDASLSPENAETDVDCGGPVCPACPNLFECLVDTDCVSRFCQSGTCVPIAATCFTGTQDGSETDVDCGGPDCPPCIETQLCVLDDDCTSGFCGLISAGASQSSDFSWVDPPDVALDPIQTTTGGVTFTFDVGPAGAGFTRPASATYVELPQPANAPDVVHPVTVTFSVPLTEFALNVGDLDLAADEFLDQFQPSPVGVTGDLDATGNPIVRVDPTAGGSGGTVWWQFSEPTSGVVFNYNRAAGAPAPLSSGVPPGLVHSSDPAANPAPVWRRRGE